MMSNYAASPDPQETETAQSTFDAQAPAESDAVEGSASVPKRRSGLRETIETLILALLIFFGVRQFVLNFQVDGESMFPNLHNGEMLLVNRHAYEEYNLSSLVDWIPGVDVDDHTVTPFGAVERGDIIVFNPPNDDKPYIKRIIGLPGDVITFANDHVYVNSVEVVENHIIDPTRCPTSNCQRPVTVPEGHVYVLGDNRDNSDDSRYFGPVPIDDIIGKAIVTYWPLDEIGRVPHYDYSNIPAAQASSTD
jgi:signal peptidase I